ncbi:hypothetical protein DZS_13400 [Dickeya ananatis]
MKKNHCCFTQLTLADKNGKWDDAGELHLTPKSIKSIEKYKRQKLTPTSGIFFFHPIPHTNIGSVYCYHLRK